MKLSKKLSLWFANSEADQEFEMIQEAKDLEKKYNELKKVAIELISIVDHEYNLNKSYSYYKQAVDKAIKVVNKDIFQDELNQNEIPA